MLEQIYSFLVDELKCDKTKVIYNIKENKIELEHDAFGSRFHPYAGYDLDEIRFSEGVITLFFMDQEAFQDMKRCSDKEKIYEFLRKYKQFHETHNELESILN